MALSNGATFAGFTIVRLLGSGGMGEVYVAQHPRLPRRDALKLLPPEWSGDEEYRTRFVREADLASTLWHPHIVGVHDRGESDGQLWISMDFVDGQDAARLLAERYPAGMPAEDVVRIVTAVANGLDYAHKRGLLHRDVKPANVMLTHVDDDGEQRVLLTDFGIARNLDDISGLTTTNMTVGTVAYAAPEQLMGEEIDGRADQYALAATTYHLLTGSQLFPHSNPAVVISRHLNAEPPRLTQARPELADLDRVFAVALSKNPADRFANCGDFAAALREAASGHSTQTALRVTPRPTTSTDSTVSPNAETQTAPIPPTPPPPTQRPNQSANAAAGPLPQVGPRLTRTHLVVAAALLAAVAIVAVFVLWPSGKRTQSAETSVAPSTSLAGMPVPTTTTSTVVPHIAVPPDIAAAGKLIVGTNVPYTPAEYRDTKGNIVGFDIDLLDAAAGELGLTTEFRASAFDQLIPAVNTGDTNVAASYLTDTREREQAVDMVTYHSGGSLWAQRPVARIDPNNACGLRVAVQATTTQETDELPAKSRACAAAGKPEIEILSFEGQDQATNAVVHGQADAMSADSAVTGYAVRISQGQIVAAGQIFDAAPVGWVVPKGSPLGPALRQALQRLIDSGRYMDILTKWGVEKGAITDSKINDATY